MPVSPAGPPTSAPSDCCRAPSPWGSCLRAKRFPYGGVLLTGTSIVPDDSFTLTPGDEVEISATGLGILRNAVRPLDMKTTA